MKKTKKDFKIKDSKGNLFFVCPFLEKIQEVLDRSKIDIHDKFEISMHLESIRMLAKAWQEEGFNINSEIEVLKPYNFSAVIKTLKIKFPKNSCEINKIVGTYL